VSRGELGFAHVVFDGERLSADPHSRGRRLRLDARCLRDERVAGAYAHVCASTDPDAVLRFDEPEVQQVRRDALEHWIPLLGAELVCLSTFSLDSSLCGGAVTVARTPELFADDPFARLFPATVAQTGIFCAVPAPAGPVIERYSGVPWPGGCF
jgi:hypothetical protein